MRASRLSQGLTLTMVRCAGCTSSGPVVLTPRLATIFVPTSTSSDQDITNFFTLYADPLDPHPSTTLQNALATFLDLYPNDPARGSPFGTGNDTFGLGSEYKRVAEMAVDVAFNGPRRAWAEAATRSGVKAFCYLFSDPQAVAVPSQGGACSTLGYPSAGLELTTNCSRTWDGARLHLREGIPGWQPTARGAFEPNDARLLDLIRRFTRP